MIILSLKFSIVLECHWDVVLICIRISKLTHINVYYFNIIWWNSIDHYWYTSLLQCALLRWETLFFTTSTPLNGWGKLAGCILSWSDEGNELRYRDVYGDTVTTEMGQVPGSGYLVDPRVDSPHLILQYNTHSIILGSWSYSLLPRFNRLMQFGKFYTAKYQII